MIYCGNTSRVVFGFAKLTFDKDLATYTSRWKTQLTTKNGNDFVPNFRELNLRQ